MDVVTRVVTVARTSMWSIGVKNWYVFQDTEGNRYQRWSFQMDDTDEVLMLLREGDLVQVAYDPQIHLSGSPRNMICGITIVS